MNNQVLSDYITLVCLNECRWLQFWLGQKYCYNFLILWNSFHYNFFLNIKFLTKCSDNDDLFISFEAAILVVFGWFFNMFFHIL